MGKVKTGHCCEYTRILTRVRVYLYCTVLWSVEASGAILNLYNRLDASTFNNHF